MKIVKKFEISKGAVSWDQAMKHVTELGHRLVTVEELESMSPSTLKEGSYWLDVLNTDGLSPHEAKYYSTEDFGGVFKDNRGHKKHFILVKTLKSSSNPLESHDNVNSPAHYNQGKYEAIVIIEDKMSRDEFIGYLKGNIYKYMLRYKLKNGVEDLKKAEFYLKRLITKEESDE